MKYISIPHYRGLKEKYNELLHGEGIYFTTDTHEIIANKASYGDKIAKWKIEDGLLTLTLSSGETVEINFPEATETSKGMMSKEDKKKLDDIVANGAEKLANSRTIWGQSFDGTADISGDITLDGAIISADTKLVDLGLPSGTLWMDRNVGASSPSDYGLYFAWGETDGYTADEVGSKKQFSWTDYKYANGDYKKLTKYCNDSNYGDDGYTDSLVTLETTDDTVLQNVHKYSMPTKEQLRELLDNTTSEWTTLDGVNGSLFTSKTNGNSIFVPAAGSGLHGSMSKVGSGGYLWSSSLDESCPRFVWYLYFYSSRADVNSCSRCGGLSVRGVATSAEGNKTINLPSTSGTLALDNVATDTTDGLMSSSDKSKIDNIENTYLPLAGGTMNKDAGITLISDNNQAVLNSKGLTLDVASLDTLELKLPNVILNQNKLSIAGGSALLTPESLVFSDTGLKLGGTNLLEFKSNETMKSLWFGDSDNYSYIKPNGGFEIGVVSSYVTKKNIPNTCIKIYTGNKLPGAGYGIQTNTWISSLGDWSTYLFLSNPLYGLLLALVRLNSQGLSLPHAAQYKNPIVRSLPYTNENPAQNEGISPFYTIGPKDTSFTTEYDAVAPLVQDSTDTSKWYIPNEYINADYLPLTGGTMTGNITLKGNTVKTISSAETHTLQSIVTPEIIRVVWDDSLTLESNETRITATEVTTPKLVVTGTSSDDILLGDGETTSLSSILKQITTNKNAIDEINNKLTWVTLE